MFKKIISGFLALAMVGSIATVAVAAEEVPEKTYNYVALGDSIAAGYGLTAPGTAVDPALILSEQLIANPVQTAYAQVFGNRLAEIGAENGYTTTATNLSSTAYRAEDVAKTITTPGYKGAVCEHILDTFVAPGTSDVLLTYHDIYNKYLPKADMVSIQLGGNDIIMGMIYPMIESDNPILNDVATATALLLFGRTPKEALGAGVQLLMRDKDLITVDHVTEAALYFADVMENQDRYVQTAVDNVETVIQEVKKVNPNADIALIDMFNPYGNSLEYDGQVRDFCNVMQNIFVKAIDEAINVDVQVGDVTFEPVADPEQKAEELEQKAVEVNEIVVSNDYFNEMRKERLQALLNIVVTEMAYPVQYLVVGKNIDPQLRSLNEKLAALADTYGATLVDVYDISNECNTDPHPTVEGHKEIADRLEATMSDIILAKMKGDEPAPAEIILGDVNGDGKVDVSDATALQGYLADMEIEGFVEEAADANEDGSVNVSDVTELQNFLAELLEETNIGKPIVK
jgi:lysophospholipase L1-like esterase